MMMAASPDTLTLTAGNTVAATLALLAALGDPNGLTARLEELRDARAAHDAAATKAAVLIADADTKARALVADNAGLASARAEFDQEQTASARALQNRAAALNAQQDALTKAEADLAKREAALDASRAVFNETADMQAANHVARVAAVEARERDLLTVSDAIDAARAKHDADVALLARAGDEMAAIVARFRVDLDDTKGVAA